ncbi:sensor histidine kinase [Streptomyces sp. BRA346]|uniref:sensor histidine kinase n=1 Tax=Streptomyces sp. BRA346 TaxID=2878199 RepID=UPI0040643458
METGAGEREVNLAAERYGVEVRATVISLCGVFGIFTVPPGRVPVTVLLVVVTVAACAVRWRGLRRLPAGVRMGLDATAVAVPGLGQPLMGPQGVNIWVMVILGIAVITFQYEWATRPAIGLGLAALTLATYGVGYGLAAPAPGPSPFWVAARQTAEYALARVSYLIVRAKARAADRATEREAAGRREASVAAARRAAGRAYLATLHDTASATLLMVSLGDSRDWSWLPRRAHRDLEALSAVPGHEAGRVDLAELLGEVAKGAAEPDAARAVRVSARVDGPLMMPAGAALAILHGVGAALDNVARHAEVDEAELRAGRDAAGTVTVELADRGRGFIPAAVSVQRRGISGSVVGRMEAIGGRGEVDSRPGEGTRVRWEWPTVPTATDPAEPGPPRADPAADAPPEPGPEGRTTFREIHGRLVRGVRWALLLVASTVQIGLCLPQLLAHLGSYHPPSAPVVAYAVLGAVSVVTAGLLASGRDVSGWPRWCGVGLVLGASALCAATVGADQRLREGDWAFGLVGWHGLYLLFGLSVNAIGVFLGAQVVLTAIPVALTGMPDVARLATMGMFAVSICGFQFTVGVLARLLRRSAETAGSAAAREEELRTREAIAEQMHLDHEKRYATLLRTTVPLLAGLAHGSLDPRDGQVRHRCALEAARMRRLFAEADEVPDRLVHELRACIDVAERAGVTVGLAVRGARRDVPQDIRRKLADPVAAVLAAGPAEARVTVVRTGSRVRVSVVGDRTAEPDGVAVKEAAPVAVSRTAEGEKVWVEAVWEPAPAAG